MKRGFTRKQLQNLSQNVQPTLSENLISRPCIIVLNKCLKKGVSTHCVCLVGPAAGLVSPQHSSREDAEAGAPEADRQQQHHSFAPTQLPLQAA